VHKITQRADFDEVMGAGVAVNTAHFALHQRSAADFSRIGAVVPKRLAKRAVTRNTIKRQIYSLAAQCLPQANAADRWTVDLAYKSGRSSPDGERVNGRSLSVTYDHRHAFVHLACDEKVNFSAHNQTRLSAGLRF
jgi:ribonuclease P protein component